ncbi:hypothetical protein LCGC14_3098990 [marine sediment metagenome]|uniref:site-specific DNA-methyltransferase (cytosine-N(4)-specific) n=1 Tax=marine sediment metagenome TaxID=412755 RepID=A0A0F8YFS5_9ZZZZ
MKTYYQDEWVTIYHGDCREIMPQLPKVDLIVTSPPYDNLREYGRHAFSFDGLPILLYRVLTDGACCVWVVGDQVIDGSETGSSFRQALTFLDCGFRIHDTMIFQKNNTSLPDNIRYGQEFEYMFVFSKGLPKTFNPIQDRKRRWFGSSKYTKKRKVSGEMVLSTRDPNRQSNKRGNIWLYDVGYNKGASDNRAFQHPATFPEKLANDHIMSWSNPGDVILDPFLGSGTTAYCAKKLNRKCIGIEIEEKYCEIAAKRCSQGVMGLRI